jgi:hypothetical protein
MVDQSAFCGFDDVDEARFRLVDLPDHILGGLRTGDAFNSLSSHCKMSEERNSSPSSPSDLAGVSDI